MQSPPEQAEILRTVTQTRLLRSVLPEPESGLCAVARVQRMECRGTDLAEGLKAAEFPQAGCEAMLLPGHSIRHVRYDFHDSWRVVWTGKIHAVNFQPPEDRVSGATFAGGRDCPEGHMRCSQGRLRAAASELETVPDTDVRRSFHLWASSSGSCSPAR